MAFITVEPLSGKAQDNLVEYWHPFNELIERTVAETWKIDPNDIIVRLVANRTVPIAHTRSKIRGVLPEIIIYIATSDEGPLANTNNLRFILKVALQRFPSFEVKAEIWFCELKDWTVTFGPYS